MALGRPAKTLSRGQVEGMLDCLANTRDPVCNKSLRVKDRLADLGHGGDADGGRVGSRIISSTGPAMEGPEGFIPINRELRQAVVRAAGSAGDERVGDRLM